MGPHMSGAAWSIGHCSLHDELVQPWGHLQLVPQTKEHTDTSCSVPHPCSLGCLQGGGHHTLWCLHSCETLCFCNEILLSCVVCWATVCLCWWAVNVLWHTVWHSPWCTTTWASWFARPQSTHFWCLSKSYVEHTTVQSLKHVDHMISGVSVVVVILMVQDDAGTSPLFHTCLHD